MNYILAVLQAADAEAVEACRWYNEQRGNWWNNCYYCQGHWINSWLCISNYNTVYCNIRYIPNWC